MNRQQRHYYRNREKEIKRVQNWRQDNAERVKVYELNRYPENNFLNSIGFDSDKHTRKIIDKRNIIFCKDKRYTIVGCSCGAHDCKGMALVEDDETLLNLHKNMMGMIYRAPGKICITERLDNDTK